MYHHSQLQSDKKTADKANCRLSDCFTLKYKFMECKRIFVLSDLKRLKIVRIMKLFSIFMLVFTLGGFASGYSQKQVVTLNLKQCDVNTLLQEIWKQTGLRFVYNEQDVARLKRFDVNAQQKQVDEILDHIFKNTPYQCAYESDVIYITPRPVGDLPQVKQERVKLSGNIKDKNGNVLPGVTVFIGNSDIGTSSDINGNYQLAILKGNAVEIVYSFIGMKKVTYNFTATEDVRHNVVMEEDQVELQDVVVIGYGSKSARNLTSSVSSVKAKDLEKYANGATTFDNMPGGAVKGVLVNQNSGEPGAKATLNIRGITSPLKSQNNNEPLYVVDGVPFFVERSLNMLNPLSTLSPNDIESIDVLKDAAATAIYGSRGANGVVIIKTKDGHRNEQMKISLGYTLSVGNQIKKFKPLNTAKFKNLQELIIKNTLGAINKAQITDDNIIYGQIYPAIDYMANTSYDNYGNMIFDGLKDEAFGEENTNWVDETNNKNTLTHMYNLAIRGGGKLSNYSFSFNAIDQEGLFINDDMQRYNSRLSFDSDVSKRFKVGAALGYTMTKRHSGAAGEEMGITREWNVRPDVPVYDETGELYRIDGTLTWGFPVGLANPVANRQNKNKKESYQFLGNSYLEYKIFNGLKIRGDINISMFQDQYSNYNPLVAQDDRGGGGMSTLQDDRSKAANTSINFRADYNFQIEDHYFSFMVGYGWDRSFSEYTSHYYMGFPDDEVLNNAGSATETHCIGDAKSKSALNSIYARASYNYLDKYLAEINFRSDASSKFGPGNQRGYFPSISLGWRMSSENFMADTEKVDDLKLRFSWGQTGSTNIDDFVYRQFYEKDNPYIGQSTLTPGLLPNPDIKWERTSEFNGGLDYAFFNHRLFGSIDGYYRYTKGALAPSPYPLESGSTSYTSNLIDLSNKGVEIEIGGDIIRTADWTWTSKFNIALNRNKIEKLNGAELSGDNVDTYIEGQPAGVLKGYIVEKIFQNDDEVVTLNKTAVAHGANYYQEKSTGMGDFKYKDLDGNGYIDSKDREVIATPQPKFFGGFFNSVNYKNFNLSFVFQFSQGAKAAVYNMMTDMYGYIGNNIYPELYGKTWSPENPDARYARLVYTDPSKNSRFSDRYIYKTSYLRLKNITFSYNLPQNFLKKINVQSAMLFVSGSNIWTVTQWPGIDPELISSFTTSQMTLNEDPYPLSKTFTLGVKVEF